MAFVRQMKSRDEPMNPKQVTSWLNRALPSKSSLYAKGYMSSPFVANGIAIATEGIRAHICEHELASVPVNPIDDNATSFGGKLSSMLLKVRTGYRVSMPAALLREVSDVIGKQRKHDANILRITLLPDTVQFERPGDEIETRAIVSKSDGYGISGLPPLPDDGLTFAVNPGYLRDAVSIVPTAKRKQKQTAEDKVTISIASPTQPIVIDYQKLTALIMPMNV